VNPAVRWAGRLASLVGLAAWSSWLAWRVSSMPVDVVSALVLLLEVAALLVSLVLSAALWSFGSLPGRSQVTSRSAPLVDVVGEMLGVADLATPRACGADDTGEVARARRGLQLLDPRATRASRALAGPPVAVTAWAVVAVEGIRRMMFVAVLVVVLLTGRFPFELPSWKMLAAPAVAVMSFSVGHWMLSGGVLRPGTRLRWSMASVGAGLGDGTSRSGLPIRWTATLATMIVLNLAVALRGVSDRWTHGLGPMPHDERVAAMLVSWWLVLVGFAALRILAKPSLGFYGATRRRRRPAGSPSVPRWRSPWSASLRACCPAACRRDRSGAAGTCRANPVWCRRHLYIGGRANTASVRFGPRGCRNRDRRRRRQHRSRGAHRRRSALRREIRRGARHLSGVGERRGHLDRRPRRPT
jgi:hypothetical protein